MAGTLHLLANVERLPTADRSVRLNGGDHVAFGVNLSVAWSTAEVPSPRAAMLPWLWPRLMRMRCCWILNGAVDGTPFDATILPQAGVPDARVAGLHPKLNAHYGALVADPANVQWTFDATSTTTAIGETRRPWRVFLGQVSTGPAPLPQSLQLSFVIGVPPRVGAGLSLVAAPIVPAGQNPGPQDFPAATRTPLDAPRLAGGNVWEWKYDGDGPEIASYAAACPRDVVATASSLSLATQWIDAPAAGTANFEDDWQVAFERHAADGLRLGRFAAQYLLDETFPDASEFRRQIVRRGLASLRDGAALGVRPGPAGGRPVERLLLVAAPNGTGLAPITLTAAEWQAIEAAATALFPTLDAWKSFLAAQLRPAAAPTGTAPPSNAVPLDILDESHPLSLSETAAQFARLVDVVENADEPPRPAGGPPDQSAGLWDLFLAQWRLALTAANLGEPRALAILAKLRSEGERVEGRENLRALLGEELAGAYWPAFTASTQGISPANDPHGAALAERAYPAYVLFHAAHRWALAPFPAPGQITLPSQGPALLPTIPAGTSIEQAALTHLRTALEEWAAARAAPLRPARAAAAATPLAEVETTRVPQPLTFQIARLRRNPETAQAPPIENADVLRRISGFGVMMRETTRANEPWRLLNLAELQSNDGTVRIDPVVAPFRLSYRNDLQQVCVTYNNQPLIGGSPLGTREMAGYVLNASDRADVDGPLKYVYSTNPAARVPGLKFGRRYQVATFAIANAGALPIELSEPASPCKLKATFTPPAGAVRSNIDYQRKVPVGGLRLCALTTSQRGDDPLELPRIPPSVTPRARDVATLMTDRTTAAAARAVVAPAAGNVAPAGAIEPPLMLLCPPAWNRLRPLATSSVDFRIKLPQVSWECWDRWVSADQQATEDHRIDVIADVFDRRGVPLDDPAVARQLRVELFHEVDGNLVPIGAQWIDVPGPTSTTGAASEMAGAATCRCEWSTPRKDSRSSAHPASG